MNTRDNAADRDRFDASFPSVKIGIIMIALNAVWTRLFAPIGAGDAVVFALLAAHGVYLLAVSYVLWWFVWLENYGAITRADGRVVVYYKSVTFHVHVVATGLVPLLPNAFIKPFLSAAG